MAVTKSKWHKPTENISNNLCHKQLTWRNCTQLMI